MTVQHKADAVGKEWVRRAFRKERVQRSRTRVLAGGTCVPGVCACSVYVCECVHGVCSILAMLYLLLPLLL